MKKDRPGAGRGRGIYRIGLRCRSSGAIQQGSGPGDAGLQLDRLLHLRRRGGGLWAADQHVQDTITGTPLTIDQRQGAPVGSERLVSVTIGSSAAGGWPAFLVTGSLAASRAPFRTRSQGDRHLKLEDSWAAGVRVGYLVAPNVLSYVNGGYSGGAFLGVTLLDTVSGLPVAVTPTASS